MMSMTDLNSIAKVICSVDLDKHDLGWSNGNFYPVYSHTFGALWRVLQKKVCQSNDCDYEMVAEKVRNFLDEYQGGDLEKQVTSQLTKLERKIRPIGTISPEIKKVQKASKFEVEKKKSDSSASKNVELEMDVVSKSKKLKPKIDFFELYVNFAHLTKSIEDEYKPYLPYAKESCRVNWIFSPSKTNVKVTDFPEEENGYIHANTVSLGRGLDFIATIYPYQRSMFWSMALEHGNVILDVTNANDLKRNEVTAYYPEKEKQKYVFNKRMEVTCLNKTELSSTLLKYQLRVKDLKTDKEEVIDRLHYIGWEDVCGTNDAELLEVVEQLKPYLGNKKVPLVHCMGGVGRTGTALTAAAINSLIDDGSIQSERDLLEHIESLILEGRKQRGPEYVQTPDQIETLYKLGMRLLDLKKIQPTIEKSIGLELENESVSPADCQLSE